MTKSPYNSRRHVGFIFLNFLLIINIIFIKKLVHMKTVILEIIYQKK
jgi:hypothetical protein